MKRLISPLRWLRDWLAVRDLEQRLQALIDLQRHSATQDAEIRHGWALQREAISQQLAQARAAYVAAYMAPGQRMTWETA